MVDPRVGRRGFLGIRPRRWWLRPRGGHAHGKRGSGWLGTGTEIETGKTVRVRRCGQTSEDEHELPGLRTFPRLSCFADWQLQAQLV